METYFTISEFAKLRNININSLRYYEKIGILKPAKVDKNSGYRYYAPEQLDTLDTVLFCINVGIPLKELANYIDDDKFMYNDRLFETGKQLAEKRIREIQTGLEKIQYTLRYMKANQEFSDRTGTYERHIIKRRLVTMQYDGDLTDSRQLEIASSRLNIYAQEHNLSPVFPTGLIVRKEKEQLSVKLFLEIVEQNKNAEGIIEIPDGRFLCRQIDTDFISQLERVLSDTYSTYENEDIILSNIFQHHYQIGTKRCELQKRI